MVLLLNDIFVACPAKPIFVVALEISWSDEGTLRMGRVKLSRGKDRARASHGAGAAAKVLSLCEDTRLLRGLAIF